MSVFHNERVDRWFNRIDLALTGWMARYSIPLLRYSIGAVFVWFGALKFFPGLSPAEELIRVSMPDFLPMGLFIPFLGFWEVAVGLGFITGKFMRLTILLLALQMIGAISPVVLAPARVFEQFPFVLTLEGQYIIKNTVLISAALVIGATVRGGHLDNQPDAQHETTTVP